MIIDKLGRRCAMAVPLQVVGNTLLRTMSHNFDCLACYDNSSPRGEAARVPRVCSMALGYGLPPCDNNKNDLIARYYVYMMEM